MQEKVIVFSMTWTNIIAIVGVLITLALGIYNAAVNRSITIKTKFVDTITSERIKWLEKIRMDISRFSGLTSYWIKSLSKIKNSESNEVLKEIDILRVMIKLRLNPEGTYDKQIIELLDKIPLLTDKTDLTEINNALDKLTELSQRQTV